MTTAELECISSESRICEFVSGHRGTQRRYGIVASDGIPARHQSPDRRPEYKRQYGFRSEATVYLNRLTRGPHSVVGVTDDQYSRVRSAVVDALWLQGSSDDATPIGLTLRSKGQGQGSG